MIGVDFELRVHEIRAYALDLRDDILAAGERDGEDQHDARAADDHAERGQESAELIGPERFERDRQDLACDHGDELLIRVAPRARAMTCARDRLILFYALQTGARCAILRIEIEAGFVLLHG